MTNNANYGGAPGDNAEAPPPYLTAAAPMVVPPGPQGVWPPQPPPPISNMAITTLVLGVSSLFLVAFFGVGGLVTGGLAVIFGHRELGRLNPHDSSGRTMTTIGLVTGYCGAAMGFFVVLLVVAYLVFVVAMFAVFLTPLMYA